MTLVNLVKRTLLIGLVLANSAVAGEALPDQPQPNLVPYKLTNLDNPELWKIWRIKDKSNIWLSAPDDTREAYMARFKNDLNQDVVISQWRDHYACSPDNCPVSILVSGVKIFEDFACDYREGHTLTSNKNAVFLCDEVVPLRVTNKEKGNN